MVVTLPLPGQITQYFPEHLVTFLQWFAFWSFSGLLTIPWLMCVYQLVTHNLGRTKRIKHVLDEHSAPKVVIVMPCYKEIPEVLLRTVDSIVDCEYPPSCMHVFLSFDGADEDELYLNTIEKLGVPLTLDTYPRSIDVIYRSCRITVSRFDHGGKRHTQKKTFKLIDKIYSEYLKRNDNLFILFIDSDCILDRVCIQNFMYEMELKPGSPRNMLAMTGVITSSTEKNTFITVLQDMEYIHGQLFERSVESACGAVTCLPGALTMLRFSAFRRMAKYYFADKAEQCEDLFDYGKCHLGEDRWLTHLFMIGAKQKFQIQMNLGAFCKTEAVQSYRTLLKQRRRWFLGFITNEVCMLTDIRLWTRYPLLCMIRFMQNTIRTTALLFFIMVVSLLTSTQRIQNLPVGFIAISLGLNWLLMIYFSARLGRYKIMLYPVMFVVNPFFNWVYMVYGIFTAGQRTWGGPRADAGKAEGGTTVAEAIEHAESTGDDLNVVPETFKPSMQANSKVSRPTVHIPLQPAENIEGRFAQAERLPGGWYQHPNDSGMTFSDNVPRHQDYGQPRASYDSLASAATSGNHSVYMPKRIESFMSPEDSRVYHQNQNMQRPPGGAMYEQSSAIPEQNFQKGSFSQYQIPSQRQAPSHYAPDPYAPHAPRQSDDSTRYASSPVMGPQDGHHVPRSPGGPRSPRGQGVPPQYQQQQQQQQQQQYQQQQQQQQYQQQQYQQQPQYQQHQPQQQQQQQQHSGSRQSSNNSLLSAGQQSRQGRSPLARKSYMQSADDVAGIEMSEREHIERENEERWRQRNQSQSPHGSGRRPT
jgi:chitin synthase